MALFLANLARIIRPQGPKLNLELDFISAIVERHLPGWEYLPFIDNGGEKRPSIVDLKGSVAPPGRIRLVEVRNLF